MPHAVSPSIASKARWVKASSVWRNLKCVCLGVEEQMAISESLKALLRRFGEIQATTSFYGHAQLAEPAEFPGENYPLCNLESGEPALIVKINADGSSRIEAAIDPDGRVSDVVKVMELPEDEFWYFEAFRPALSRLSLGAPGFLFEMELVTLYGVFEAFLSDALRDYFRLQLKHLGPKAQREVKALGNPSSQIDAAVNQVIDREVRRLTYNSVASVPGPYAGLSRHAGFNVLIRCAGPDRGLGQKLLAARGRAGRPATGRCRFGLYGWARRDIEQARCRPDD